MSDESFRYLSERVDDQIKYFDQGAITNQKKYRRLKSAAIVYNILTTMTIALAFTVPADYKTWMGILALVLSTVVLAMYQWEEFHNYGKVISLRVWYANGYEVEYGITAPEWAEPPLDEGTRKAIKDGVKILFERDGLLSAHREN